LPTFGNRSINPAIRLKAGETNMLAGLIRDEERTVLSGVPGLSDIPVVGRLFAHNRKQTQETDIILTLTPRIVRVLDLRPEDLQPFRVGRDSGAPLVDVPAAPVPPRQPGGEPPAVFPPIENPPARGVPLPVPQPAEPIKPPAKPGNGSPRGPDSR
jgi:general secretion pathway protein D